MYNHSFSDSALSGIPFKNLHENQKLKRKNQNLSLRQAQGKL